MKLLTILLALLPLAASAFQPDVVIDDLDSTDAEFVGSWEDDTNLTNAYRNSAKRTTGSTSNITEYARFHKQLPATGPWRVYVWHNGRIAFGNEVQVEVKTAGGTIANAKMPQQVYAAYWMLVGTYWFDSNEEAEVKILHNDSGMLSADAVRFSLAQPEVILDSTGDSTGIGLYNAAGVISSSTWLNHSVNYHCHELNTRRSVTPGSSVVFTPSLPTPGEYEVSVWMPRRGGSWVIGVTTSVTTAEVEVHSRSGVSTHTVTLPEGNGAWVQVGTTPFLFSSGGSADEKVVIKGPPSASYTVPADAVRWSKVGTFSVFQDDDDGAGSPGVTLGTKLEGQSLAWTTQFAADRLARRWTQYYYQPFGLTASRADNNNQRATYTPPLPEQGLYDIYLWYPWASDNATTSLLTVNGTYNSEGNGVNGVTRLVDQNVGSGNWLHAGRYVLDANLAGQPTKSWLTFEPDNNATGKFTKADAILFLRDGEEADADGDGLPDWKEVILHTSSSTDLDANGRYIGWDTDGDGMSDGYEYSLGLNPLAAPQVTTDPNIVGVTVLTPLSPTAQ